MRKAKKRKILFIALFIILLVILFHPEIHGARPNDYIDTGSILENLNAGVAINFTSGAIADCEYYENVLDVTSLSPSLVDGDLIEGHKIKEGGEYAPFECRAKYSTAIIVPYRDRAEQLRGFLVYIHTFLRRQRIHYRIYVIEQVDIRPFNRAKLLNIGAQIAMKTGFSCLILHDVDLLPLKPANLYVCTKNPRHMSSSINKFRFVLPYADLFGGVVSMTSKQYKAVNGMSNEYYGWGGEDEDLYIRLSVKGLKVCRFDSDISKYYMAVHGSQEKGEKVQKLLEGAEERIEMDGLNNLQYTEVATVLHPLFTHIMVDL